MKLSSNQNETFSTCSLIISAIETEHKRHDKYVPRDVAVSVTLNQKLSIHLKQQTGQIIYILRICCSGKNTNYPIVDSFPEKNNEAFISTLLGYHGTSGGL